MGNLRCYGLRAAAVLIVTATFSVLCGFREFSIDPLTETGNGQKEFSVPDEPVYEDTQEPVDEEPVEEPVQEQEPAEQPVMPQDQNIVADPPVSQGIPVFTPPTAVLPEVIEEHGSDIYLVGDSRTLYGYMDTLDTRANWYAACGTSYPYFAQNYIPRLDKKNLRGKKIVILYGINDISYYGKETACLSWISFYNTKAQEWIARGAEVYACSVLGYDYSSLTSPGVTAGRVLEMNKNVEAYNKLIETMLPYNIRYIRLHYSTVSPLRDGVHYTPAEDRLLYQGLINYLLLN